METRNIVEELRRQGHIVETYTRTKLVIIDGESKRVPDAVRIVKIDGVSFAKSGAEGNKAARKMVGQSLSRKQTAQRRKARAVIHKMRLTKKQEKILKQLQKDQKKRKKPKEKRSHIKKLKKREGSKRADEALTNKLIHAKHYAYFANIEWFITLIPADKMPKTLKALGQSSDYDPQNPMKPNGAWGHLRDEDLKAMQEIVYNAGNGIISWDKADTVCFEIIKNAVKNNPSFASSMRPESHRKKNFEKVAIDLGD